MTCIQCEKETANPKFCSRTCSVSYWNARQPKRKKATFFCSCGRQLYSKKSITCRFCTRVFAWDTVTLQEVQDRAGYQKNARIRALARSEFRRQQQPRKCMVCGYEKHVEVAHIKDINSYSLDTPVAQVNHISNLVGLCPNHHWEFDNDFL